MCHCQKMNKYMVLASPLKKQTLPSSIKYNTLSKYLKIMAPSAALKKNGILHELNIIYSFTRSRYSRYSCSVVYNRSVQSCNWYHYRYRQLQATCFIVDDYN